MARDPVSSIRSGPRAPPSGLPTLPGCNNTPVPPGVRMEAAPDTVDALDQQVNDQPLGDPLRNGGQLADREVFGAPVAVPSAGQSRLCLQVIAPVPAAFPRGHQATISPPRRRA